MLYFQHILHVRHEWKHTLKIEEHWFELKLWYSQVIYDECKLRLANRISALLTAQWAILKLLKTETDKLDKIKRSLKIFTSMARTCIDADSIFSITWTGAFCIRATLFNAFEHIGWTFIFTFACKIYITSEIFQYEYVTYCILLKLLTDNFHQVSIVK